MLYKFIYEIMNQYEFDNVKVAIVMQEHILSDAIYWYAQIYYK